jgi:hypothetical protein
LVDRNFNQVQVSASTTLKQMSRSKRRLTLHGREHGSDRLFGRVAMRGAESSESVGLRLLAIHHKPTRDLVRQQAREKAARAEHDGIPPPFAIGRPGGKTTMVAEIR